MSITSLSKFAKDPLFSLIYSVDVDVGTSKVPAAMKDWVKKSFGSVAAVEKQKIVRVDNKITFETALFNELRTKRPMDLKKDVGVQKIIDKSRGGSFGHPTSGTPADSFGRVKGKSSISASNVAKYDAAHGLVIFNEHDPLKFSLDSLKDYFKTVSKWIGKASKQDKKRIYPYLLWNCLWRGGSSIIHGHMQILLGRKHHYGEIERLRHFSEEYAVQNGSDYFEDLFKVHKKVGLGFEAKNSRVLAHLTPKKEKEVLVISGSFEALADPVFRVLKAYKGLGVQSFNLGIYMPPLDGSWKTPFVARIVDRGDLNNKTSDIGGMEIFGAASIIGSDPYKVFSKVKKMF